VVTATKILIVGGVLSLAAAFVIGYILSNKRLKPPNVGPHYLDLSHRNALWEGFMLLDLGFAAQFARLPDALAIAAASLLVASALFQIASSMTSWLMGTKDFFVERSLGLRLATINAILATIGLAILIVGVFRGL
jgi:hypothetical protein